MRAIGGSAAARAFRVGFVGAAVAVLVVGCDRSAGPDASTPVAEQGRKKAQAAPDVDAILHERLRAAERAGGRALHAGKHSVESLRGIERHPLLTTVELYDNALQDLSPLSALSNLQQLDVSANHVEDLSALSGLTALTTLRVQGNTVSELEALSEMRRLRWLNIAHNRVETLAALAGSSTLRTLRAQGNRITDLSPLATLTDLRHLELAGNRIVDVGPLLRLSALTHLDLSGNRIVRVEALSSLTKLKALYLDENPLDCAAAAPTLEALRARGADVRSDCDTAVSASEGRRWRSRRALASRALDPPGWRCDRLPRALATAAADVEPEVMATDARLLTWIRGDVHWVDGKPRGRLVPQTSKVVGADFEPRGGERRQHPAAPVHAVVFELLGSDGTRRSVPGRVDDSEFWILESPPAPELRGGRGQPGDAPVREPPRAPVQFEAWLIVEPTTTEVLAYVDGELVARVRRPDRPPELIVRYAPQEGGGLAYSFRSGDDQQREHWMHLDGAYTQLQNHPQPAFDAPRCWHVAKYSLGSTSMRHHRVSATFGDVFTYASYVPQAVGENSPPRVMITRPIENALITGRTHVFFEASVSDEQDRRVRHDVTWVSPIDGKLGKGRISFNGTRLSEGIHDLRAIATDSGGLTTTALVTVEVVRFDASGAFTGPKIELKREYFAAEPTRARQRFEFVVASLGTSATDRPIELEVEIGGEPAGLELGGEGWHCEEPGPARWGSVKVPCVYGASLPLTARAPPLLVSGVWKPSASGPARGNFVLGRAALAGAPGARDLGLGLPPKPAVLPPPAGAAPGRLLPTQWSLLRGEVRVDERPLWIGDSPQERTTLETIGARSEAHFQIGPEASFLLEGDAAVTLEQLRQGAVTLRLLRGALTARIEGEQARRTHTIDSGGGLVAVGTGHVRVRAGERTSVLVREGGAAYTPAPHPRVPAARRAPTLLGPGGRWPNMQVPRTEGWVSRPSLRTPRTIAFDAPSGLLRLPAHPGGRPWQVGGQSFGSGAVQMRRQPGRVALGGLSLSLPAGGIAAPTETEITTGMRLPLSPAALRQIEGKQVDETVAAAVRSAVGRLRPRLQRCFEASAAEDPHAGATLTLHLTLANGSLSGLQSPSHPSPSLATCLGRLTTRLAVRLSPGLAGRFEAKIELIKRLWTRLPSASRHERAPRSPR